MTDTTPTPRSNYPATEVDEVDEGARDAGHSVGDEARQAERDVEDRARNISKRISDAVEDVIPGDSDHDGH